MNEQKIAILVDSGSDVPPELLERYHIFMIPLKILFNEGEYLDGVTIDAAEVYRRLPTEIPKTSLPDGNQITEVLDRIYNEGYRQVLGICISSGLSGTCNMLRVVCEEYGNLECRIIDSKNISIGSGIIAVRAAQLAKVDLLTLMVGEFPELQGIVSCEDRSLIDFTENSFIQYRVIMHRRIVMKERAWIKQHPIVLHAFIVLLERYGI